VGHRAADVEPDHGGRDDGAAPAGGRDRLHATLVRQGPGGVGEVVTRYVVHRGGAALWPENTLLAFRNAIALGARTLEFDVHGTADGDVAVIHDPTVDRTTNGVGAVGRLTVAELRGLRARTREGR